MKRTIALSTLIAFLLTTSAVFAQDVFKTANGIKYHKQTCRLIKNKNAVKIDKEEAIKQGLEPCKKCFKDELASLEAKQTQNKK